MASRKRRDKKRARGSVQRPRAPAARSMATKGMATQDSQGRRHLRLFQDPTTGSFDVGLQAPLFTAAWQNELAASAATSAAVGMQAGVTKSAVVGVARQAMDSTSRLAEGLLATAENGRVACKPGCDHCCYQSVGVTTAEALAIVDHLMATRSAEALAGLRVEFAEARARTRGLTSDERFSPEHPCPFLKSGECSIYEVRPLSCRGMNALDAEECSGTLRDPERRAAFLRTGVGRRSFLEPIRAFHAISAGIQLGLGELYGLDMRPLDLTAAVDELLAAEPSLTADWLRGKSPLAAARGGDSTESAEIHGLSGRVPDRKMPP